MKLSDYEILPGVVLDAEDPKKIGRVRASVPTWFDTDVIEQDALPWISPFTMSGYQSFTKLENGRKIWVMHNSKNEEEWWYFPMFEQNSLTKQIASGYDDTEILVSRTFGDNGDTIISYNSHEGIVLSVGETRINITPSREIHIDDGKSSFDIVGGNISIGDKSKEMQQAVMGQTLKDSLDSLGASLISIGSKMAGNQFTSPFSADFIKMGKNLKEECTKLLSDTIKTSK